MNNYINQKHGQDCLQATLSNLLSIDYEEIPEFYKTYDKNNRQWITMLDEWLNKNEYCRVVFDITYNNGKTGIPFYCSLKRLKCIGILEKPSSKWSHAVLLELSHKSDHSYNMEILYDPKTNSEYNISHLIQIELILKYYE